MWMNNSTLSGSPETTNGAKLSRLLVDGGTEVLRKTFDSYHSPACLGATLNSNYASLNNLLKKKVLRKSQWDKLFPPDGSKPDSNSFDITLLVILLTNICGLLPPASGWHINPPSSDTSLEANIARIKYYRNELYGHVSKTSLDQTTFTSLWKEISFTLVAMGLSHTEVDRLQAERCGEEDYLNVLFEWVDTEADFKSKMREVIKAQSRTHKSVEEIYRSLKLAPKNLRDVGEYGVLGNLAKSEFTGDIEFHAGRYQEDTREWVFQEIQEWLDDRNSPNRVMVLSGNAGMGKSVIAAVMCKRMKEASRLSGSHFCQHNNVRYRNPVLMLQSLACHLSCALPEYKHVLVQQLSRNLGEELENLGIEELFALLFKEPLSFVKDSERNMLIVIDGLDESEYRGRNELLDVISNHFSKLPSWIRFFVTTRPERYIADSLRKLHPIYLEPNDERNAKDIQLLFEKRLHHLVIGEGLHMSSVLLNKLVEKCEGLMLYAYFLVEYIKSNGFLPDPQELDNGFLLGIASVYSTHFKRLESALKKEHCIEEESFLDFLCVITASREPLPIGFISKILGLNMNSRLDLRKSNKAISCVSNLLPIRSGRLHIIHKSVKDWLTGKSWGGDHDFVVKESVGHSILAGLCAELLDGIKQNGVRDEQFSDTEKYALQHAVHHLLEVEENLKPHCLEKIVKDYVIDVELVYAKVCVDNTAASEDILCIPMQKVSKELPGELSRTLDALLFLLQKHRNTLRSLPRVFFQLAVNEGGPELSFAATNALGSKYSDILYMECLDKDVSQNVTSVELHCSNTVACFDISPKLDFMVCECRDGTIQFWSLRKCKLEWARPVLFSKDYSGVPFGCAYRIAESSQGSNQSDHSRPLSCYRSVVFHPNGKFILPGSLNRVYTIGGEQVVLFPASVCNFSVCFFSNDRTRLLSDCLNDATCVIMWSLATGKEITRVSRTETILSFACSQDGMMLAISHRQSICLVNVTAGFQIQRELVTSVPYGFMNFLTGNQILGCLYLTKVTKRQCCFSTNCVEDTRKRLSNLVSKTVNQELDISSDSTPWEFEHRTSGGFLLGDTNCTSGEALSTIVPFWEVGYISLVSQETVLMSSPDLNYMSLINLRKLEKRREDSKTTVVDVVFSLCGVFLYVVTKMGMGESAVTAWNVTAGKVRGHLKLCLVSIVPVKDGVVLMAEDKSPELWNVELTVCTKRWSASKGISKMIAVSENKIMCLRKQGDIGILTVTSDEEIGIDILAQECTGTHVVACNSRFQLLTVGLKLDCHHRPDGRREGMLRLSGPTSLIWKRGLLLSDRNVLPRCIFSPKEEFIVVWKEHLSHSNLGVHILDALSGETYHTLPNSKNVVECKFVSEDGCLVYNSSINILRLFNVSTGELLSVMDFEERPCCLGVCLQQHLIAVCLTCSTFKLISVRLPNTEDRGNRFVLGIFDIHFRDLCTGLWQMFFVPVRMS